MGKFGIGGGELSLELLSSIENQDRFIDLHPLGTSGLEVSKELYVDGKKLGQERDGLEASASLLGVLAKGEESDRTDDNGTSGDAKILRLTIFLKGLVEVELELGLLRELRDNEVVIRVEPDYKTVRTQRRRW